MSTPHPHPHHRWISHKFCCSWKHQLSFCKSLGHSLELHSFLSLQSLFHLGEKSVPDFYLLLLLLQENTNSPFLLELGHRLYSLNGLWANASCRDARENNAARTQKDPCWCDRGVGGMEKLRLWYRAEAVQRLQGVERSETPRAALFRKGSSKRIEAFLSGPKGSAMRSLACFLVKNSRVKPGNKTVIHSFIHSVFHSSDSVWVSMTSWLNTHLIPLAFRGLIGKRRVCTEICGFGTVRNCSSVVL